MLLTLNDLLQYDLDKVYAEWKAKTEAERMFLLLQHYAIDADDAIKWFRLVLALARDHVPGFSVAEGRGAGRPSKIKGRLADLIERPTPKRGRPKRERNPLTLIEAVEKTKMEHGLTGRGSDKQALEIILTAIAKKNNESVTKLLKEELPHFQKRLSDARKLIPKIRE